MVTDTRKFTYYHNLNNWQRRIYDQSDAVSHIVIPAPHRLYPAINNLKNALATGDKFKTQAAAQTLINNLCYVLKVPAVYVKVMDRRPSRYGGEMHGLYNAQEGRRSMITIWMRTAKRKDVVAFRSFLRTMIHEFLHHLDYTFLRLKDSLHTEGFFRRESSIVKTLLGENS